MPILYICESYKRLFEGYINLKLQKMKKISLIFLILIISSCSSSNTIDIKSPCVSSKRGPCGPKIPVNDWWLNGHKNDKIVS